MSQSNLFVPLTLDRERRMKLTIHDVDDVLDRIARPGAPEPTLYSLMEQLGGLRWRAYSAALHAGLRHDDVTIRSPQRAEELLASYLEAGGSLAPVAHAIKRAMLLSGAMPWDMWRALATAEELEKYGSEDPRATTERVT